MYNKLITVLEAQIIRFGLSVFVSNLYNHLAKLPRLFENTVHCFEI